MRHLSKRADICHSVPLMGREQSLHLKVFAMLIRSHFAFSPFFNEAARGWRFGLGGLLFPLLAQGGVLLVDACNSLA